jgi:hypothetical protein
MPYDGRHEETGHRVAHDRAVVSVRLGRPDARRPIGNRDTTAYSSPDDAIRLANGRERHPARSVRE